jgi:hypothetical protein
MLTDDEIVEIRDEHIPSQGEQFDCIIFARAIEARVRVEALEEAAKTCEQAIQLCADHIRALAEGMG